MVTTSNGIDVLTGQPPPNYQFSYQQNLYHLPEYLQCQPALPDFSYYLIDQQLQTVKGVIHFHRRQEQWISQLYAPFGSFQGEWISKAAIEAVINIFEHKLNASGGEQIILNHPAPCYQQDLWGEVLTTNGYVVRRRINHHILVDNDSLVDKMHQMEKRKLARGSRFAFTVHPHTDLSELYEFIVGCRNERGQTLSMSLDELKQVVMALPERFLLCSVNLNGRLAAASVIIKVNSKCWYQFYPAHSKLFNRDSPLVLLISELYQLAKSQGGRIIDLGTSEVNGNPIEGLLTFKDRIGGTRGIQCTYSKTFL